MKQPSDWVNARQTSIERRAKYHALRSIGYSSAYARSLRDCSVSALVRHNLQLVTHPITKNHIIKMFHGKPRK